MLDNCVKPLIASDRLTLPGLLKQQGYHTACIGKWHLGFTVEEEAQGSSDQLICLTDFMATCADLLGVKLPDNAGEDSVSILPALQGKARQPLREAVVHHSIQGNFSIRQGPWKLELCAGSGGWGKPTDAQAIKEGLPAVQLYNLAADIGEQHNLESSNPDRVNKMTALLEQYVADGRSTPGSKQQNDVPVKIRKTKSEDSESD